MVKAIGLSDYNVTQLQWTLDIATEPVEMLQVEWNSKTHDDSLKAFCDEHKILLQAWSPLGGAEGSVLGEPALKAAATAHNVSTAQVALRWSLQKGVAVVVGSANPSHIASDLDVFGFNLTTDEMGAISQLEKQVLV